IDFRAARRNPTGRLRTEHPSHHWQERTARTVEGESLAGRISHRGGVDPNRWRHLSLPAILEPAALYRNRNVDWFATARAHGADARRCALSALPQQVSQRLAFGNFAGMAGSYLGASVSAQSFRASSLLEHRTRS